MTYAKQIADGKVISLLTYDYEPVFEEDSDTVIITEEEYNAIWEEFIANRPKPDPNRISEREALEIITGGGV